MKINIVSVGNLKEEYLILAQKEYVKRLQRFCDLTIIEIKQCSIDEPSVSKQQELVSILPYLNGFIIVLDIKGKEISSEEFSRKINAWGCDGISTITLVIGGSHGLHDEIIKKANFKLSFSPMTFPHQLIRINLLEQIYRAYTIINNIPYHK